MAIRKSQKWLYPHAVEREYRQALTSFAVEIQRETERIISQREDEWRDDSWRMEWLQKLARLPEQLTLNFVERAVLAIQLAVEQVNRFNHRQFQKLIHFLTGGMHIAKEEPELDKIVKEWVQENVSLIKSLPEQHVEKVKNLIEQAALEGTDEDVLIEQIRKAGKTTESRADLIAEDQIGKLNGQLMQMRQQNIGVEKYRWRGTLDERERDSHLRREGKVFSWDEPPSDGHPGEPIRCRCWAEMILPELEALDGALFGDGGDNRHYVHEMKRRGLMPEAGMPELVDDVYHHFGYVPRGKPKGKSS